MRIASSMSQLYTTAVDNYERRVTDVRKPTVSIAKNFRTPRSTEKLYAPMVARSLAAPATHVPQLHPSSTHLKLFARLSFAERYYTLHYSQTYNTSTVLRF
jgi:hypothetical protein